LASATAGWVLCALAGLAVIYWIGRLGINWYLGVTLDRVAPSILIAGAALATMLLGLELGAAGSSATEPAPVARGGPGAGRRRLVVPVGALAAGMVVVAFSDSRPSLHRAGSIDPSALGRELAVQVGQELASAGYPYLITATCNEASPQGLDFACLAQTRGPVGKRSPQVLYWHITVGCAPAATGGPRCFTSQGEALN